MAPPATARALAGTDRATGSFVIDTITNTVGQTANLNYSQACHAMWGSYVSTTADQFTYVSLWAIAAYSGSGASRLLNPDSGAPPLKSGAITYTTPIFGWAQSFKFCLDQDPIDPGDNYTSGSLSGCTRWR